MAFETTRGPTRWNFVPSLSRAPNLWRDVTCLLPLNAGGASPEVRDIIDNIPGQGVSSGTGSAGYVAAAEGIGMEMTGTSQTANTGYIELDSALNFGSLGPLPDTYSLAFAFRLLGAIASGGTGSLMRSGNPPFGDFYLSINTPSGGLDFQLRSGNKVFDDSTPAVTDNDFNMVSVSVTAGASGSYTYFVNGTRSSGNHSATRQSNSPVDNWFNTADTHKFQNGIIAYYVIVWARLLDDSEHRALAADPFCMFRMRDDVEPWYAFPESAPGGDVLIQPGAGTMAFTGYDPTMRVALRPSAGTMALTGHDPTIMVSGSFLLQPPAGTMAFVSGTPRVIVPSAEVDAGGAGMLLEAMMAARKRRR